MIYRDFFRDQANYAFFQTIRGLIDYLPENLRRKDDQFKTGETEPAPRSPRWKECLDKTSERFKPAVGAMYVRKYYQEGTSKAASEMVFDVKKEVVQLIGKLEWMDENTRKTAIDKALAIQPHVGYPVEYNDDKELEGRYTGLNFTSSNNYLEVVNQVILYEENYDFGQIFGLINKTDWRMRMSVTDVNAVYSPQENSIQIVAGILQGIFYDKDRPQYMNYGGVGYIIGHEVTHGFDNVGRTFDKIGDRKDWWAEKTSKAFDDKAKCIIKQYGDIVVPEVGKNLNGEKTQGDNIADNGGIKIAYLAYNSWVKRNGPELPLPGLNFTAEQLFWITSANCWCGTKSKESYEDDIATNEHAPERYRVIVPFGNIEYFAKDFNCPLGSKMNPKHKCQDYQVLQSVIRFLRAL
ncbi:hypothetical protein ILUMI_07844 [Ignelater luminosus]|uniref:Neprilysin n=1 Tax=Ignelater luminosus TaxID=2038154 RepID=A0A8K0GDZ9_IGNLU|nr:hypothetical protein ILUMI_07844 [Ignelater luminosus]